MRLWLVLAASGAIVLGACGGDDPQEGGTDPVTPHGTPSSCDLTKDLGYCLDFAESVPKDTAQTNCDNAKGAIDVDGVVNPTGSCPIGGRVGTCVATVNDLSLSYRYYGPKYTTETANENCAKLGNTNGSGGLFTPD